MFLLLTEYDEMLHHIRRFSLEIFELGKLAYRRNELAWFSGELRGTALFRCRQLGKGNSLQNGESLWFTA